MTPNNASKSPNTLIAGVRLYHRASASVAWPIRTSGFRDGTDHYGTGVWFTDDPIAVSLSRGPVGERIVEVVLGEDYGALAQFEAITEGNEGPALVGVNYREWLIPAEWIRAHALSVRLVADDEVLRDQLASDRQPIPALTVSASPV